MKPNKRYTYLSICLILSGFYSTAALALATDSEQPITIDSNTATYDDKTAISIYTGDVISIQGSIKVNSDKLVVYFIDGDAEKLVFTGNPARFKQTPSPGKEDIIGDALIGEYYPKKNLLILKNNATVKQGNGTYKSDYIEYDINTSLVKAGDKSTDSKRVRVTLQPKAKK
jgi:lipopolysaccharide export system protein LptA